jgi:ADP-dependent NAD(P)H-hydrate dehydratase
MEMITDLPALPPRPLEGHKGLFGRVLVVGGNEEMIGAPLLAGTAALRTGAGLVQIAMPKSVLRIAILVTPELIGLGLTKGNIARLVEAAEKADALVIGPGLGQSAKSEERLKELFRLEKPAVVDADALNFIATRKTWPARFKLQAVLTPHPGEMARLAKLIGRSTVPTDDEGRMELAGVAAKAFGQVVLLKGNRTVVSDGERVYMNLTGNSSLSKAGAGDVLSGVLGTLLAQKMSPFDAACLAAHLHGRAGEIMGEQIGLRSVLAMEVAETIPEALLEYERITNSSVALSEPQ